MRLHLEAISIHAVITLLLSAFIAENNGLAETEAYWMNLLKTISQDQAQFEEFCQRG
jgi:hypothetical protein